MIDKTISPYRATKKPGSGGMGMLISILFLRISPSLISAPYVQAESAEGGRHN